MNVINVHGEKVKITVHVHLFASSAKARHSEVCYEYT